MAFVKYARASVIRPRVTPVTWGNVTGTYGVRVAKARGSESLIARASTLVGKQFDPNEYLLTHATIVASVDVYSPQGIKTGAVTEEGFRINRKYSDYRVKPASDKFINNNLDCWSRGVLAKAYPTFIGGHNFVEHVQVENLSKGRIIDAVARDIGDSLYTDILIATSKKHKDLVEAIESGKMGTLSMGCFLPGTQVSMADGRRIAIEDVQPGDMVLTHKGRTREVVNKQIRGGKWSLRQIEAVGLPTAIPATDNHPFFVLRPPTVCACGCGKPLPIYKNGRKSATRAVKRRFLTGHDKNVYNPNNTYSLEEARQRKERLADLKQWGVQKVRADELRIGDFLCFPRVQEDAFSGDATEGKARLLGYFLAEGSYIKRRGDPVAVEFNFALAEKDTYASEVAALLKAEFKLDNDPGLQDRTDRNTCTVHVSSREVAAWFWKHGGEYSHAKKLSSEAVRWPVELQKHLVGAWINGDGHLSAANGNTSAITTSYDLACQMHLVMARCGWYARMECKVGARTADLRAVVNGGFIRDAESGRLPSFNLVISKTLGSGLVGYTDKAAENIQNRASKMRVRDDVVMFPITAIATESYEGPVHNMEVAEDHTYVVEGVAVHNCTVDGTQCTKCGHWAADETEMCAHIKYEKGNTFFDDDGQKHRVAELCGHESLDPTGGVTFIEASWVETPAFTGAVMRNVIEATEVVSRKATKVLSVPPPKWSENAHLRVAKLGQDATVVGRVGSSVTKVAEGEGDTVGNLPVAPEAVPANPFKDLEDEIADSVKTRVRERLKKELAPPALTPEDTSSTNENVNKLASRKVYAAGLEAIVRTAGSDATLIDNVASYNQSLGISFPVEVYRAALKVGRHEQYRDAESFKSACHTALRRQASIQEVGTLIRLSMLLSRRWSSGKNPQGSCHEGEVT